MLSHVSNTDATIIATLKKVKITIKDIFTRTLKVFYPTNKLSKPGEKQNCPHCVCLKKPLLVFFLFCS